MASGIEVRSIDHGDELGNNDYGLWMREQRKQDETSERDGVDGLDIFRSGSAPPTVEGSLNAVGGLFTHHGDVWSPAINKRDISEEILRSDPAYVNYYYSHVNMNPRLPPPLLSKEDWRFTQQRCSGGSMLGGIGDRRTGSKGSGNEGVNNMSLFSAQLGFSEEKEEDGAELRNGQCEWGGDGLIGLPGLGLGSGQKIIAEILQDDSSQAANISRHPSRPASWNTFDEVTSESQYPQLEHDLSSDVLSSTTGHIEGSASKSAGYSSLSYGSALGSSLSRSATPDPQHIARVSSPLVPPVGEGRINSMDKRTMTGPTLLNGFNSSESADLVAALAGMNLAGDHLIDEEKHFRSHLPHDISKQQTMFHDSFRQQSDPRYLKHDLYFNSADSGSLHQQCVSQSAKGSFHNMSRTNGYGMDRKPYYLRTDAQVDHLKLNGSNSPNYRSVGSPSSAIPNYSLSGHTINPALASMMASQLGNSSIPLFYDNATGSPVGGGGMGVDARALGGGLHENVGRARNQPVIDPMLRHYLRSSEFAAAHLNESSLDMNLLALQKAYLGNVFSPQKTERGGPHLGKSGGFSPGYCGNQALGLGMAYGGNRLVNSHLNSSVGFGSHMRQGDRRYVSGMRNLAAGGMGGWRSDMGGIMEQSFGSSLLDEFKSNKTKCLELSEISGHVFEFSADQYGSRFIQQKLETASIEEKNMVFHEIISQALPLMTDVFGNYVIQKFFEHGTAAQIRDLANELTGHVLTLSLQMYGCRVIQKAIEVVDLDQQKKMVTELDGHVMRCVRDQNGNHVIQKCIECIPEDAVHFIVSTFFDHVVHLSTHPYGCRVIQRVLEHCHDPKTQETVMDEIMQSVCMLAQDQYGNYVVQHVLEHGKPDERSAIISKLTGKIVQMSQQKFASNVIEKCLTFGDADERRAIVNEMLGATEDNEPLQVMMKDQFGNYVVQKVLETCDAEQLELLLMRIKIHLNALKKYTYGKHIVARVEKLVAAGERRIGMQASYTAT